MRYRTRGSSDHQTKTPRQLNISKASPIPGLSTISKYTVDQNPEPLRRLSAESAFQSDTNGSGGDHQGRSDLLGQLQVQDSGLNSYMQVLTGHLSHYAEEQRRLSIVPTDEMLQREARRLMFDSEDSWNQTIADHPQWQAAFREKWSSSTT